MSSENEISTFLSGWAKAEQAADIDALADLLTDDFAGIGPLGFTLSKQDWLARHTPGGGLRYASFDLHEVQIRVYGDAAIARVRQDVDGTYHGNPIPAASRATLVLVHAAGAWRLAGIQMSFVAGTPGAPPIPGRPGGTAD